MASSLFHQLLTRLDDAAVEARIEALCILVMLQEPKALNRLAALWTTEKHPEVRQVIAWAGKQLQPLKDAGYTSELGMSQLFRLHLGREDAQAVEERRKLAEIEATIRANEFNSGKTGKTGELVLRGAVAGGMLALGFGTTAASAFSPSVNMSSNMEPRPEIGKQPIIPPRPSTMDAQMWIKHLATSDSKTKSTAIIQLRDFNNPAALGALSSIFIKDPDPTLRQLAQDTSKHIYYSALYWEKRATVG